MFYRRKYGERTKAGRLVPLALLPARTRDGRTNFDRAAFEDEGRAFLHYDKLFAKLRKLYPWIDSKTIGFYLEDLKTALAKATSIEPVLNLYGPQLVSSDARKGTLPITDALVEMLLEKFTHPAPRGPHEAKQPDQVAIAI